MDDSGAIEDASMTVDNTVAGTRTKILAYLGQLKGASFVSAKKLCYDLQLRYTTAKNTLTTLEERGLVEKKIETEKGTVALFRIDPAATQLMRNSVNLRTAYVPPEWSDAYGKHPCIN